MSVKAKKELADCRLYACECQRFQAFKVRATSSTEGHEKQVNDSRKSIRLLWFTSLPSTKGIAIPLPHSVVYH